MLPSASRQRVSRVEPRPPPQWYWGCGASARLRVTDFDLDILGAELVHDFGREQLRGAVDRGRFWISLFYQANRGARHHDAFGAPSRCLSCDWTTSSHPIGSPWNSSGSGLSSIEKNGPMEGRAPRFRAEVLSRNEAGRGQEQKRPAWMGRRPIHREQAD